jgi:hypothetical protein
MFQATRINRQFRHLAVAVSLVASAAVAVTATPGEANAATACPQASVISPTSYYTLRDVGTGKVLDVSGASTADGASVLLWTSNAGLNQQWRAICINGVYAFINRNSGKALEIAGFSTAQNKAATQWTFNGGTNQKWRLNGTEAPFTLQNVNSGLSLMKSTSSNNVVQATTSSASIMVEPVASGDATIACDNGFSPVDRHELIDFDNGGGLLNAPSSTVGTRLTLNGTSGNASTEWTVICLYDNVYMFVNRASGLAAQVVNGSTADGAAVELNTFTGGTSQQFRVTQNKYLLQFSNVRSGRFLTRTTGTTPYLIQGNTTSGINFITSVIMP